MNPSSTRRGVHLPGWTLFRSTPTARASLTSWNAPLIDSDRKITGSEAITGPAYEPFGRHTNPDGWLIGWGRLLFRSWFASGNREPSYMSLLSGMGLV
jgi:hypothetical protein